MSDSKRYDNSLEPIAIIGMSGRFPGAKNLHEFWQNLRDGVESVVSFTDEELAASGESPELLKNPHYVRRGAFVSDIEMFDAAFFGFSPREAELTDPQHRLLLECAWEAIESAGYDPEMYEGRVAVFSGIGINTYLLRNLMSDPEFIRSPESYHLSIGNDKDFAPTRISYKLNLKGPSVSVNTACSTSLVALQLACQSLLSYQCDMALAGGATIQVPKKKGYLYQEGGIPSPDGYCRAFDANAKGTVTSSGVGIVLLKRLEDALADGDCIHAIIRGAAINNDGSLKVGYTAPGVEGQASVIAEAQSLAGVNPETITYIEAHGTGTPLGDPIEIEALTQAFRAGTQKKGFCAIGSVKTNIGHADTAAGIAGLIKTVLALKHGLIPPSLHFESPNPQIAFDNSPFYVNATLSEWHTEAGIPRRAGVSSFGIGGTNAHVVLEERLGVRGQGSEGGEQHLAPLTPNPLPHLSSEMRVEMPKPYHLLPLSAKTNSALDAMTANLVEYFKQHPDLNLADVAYTLQVGRKAFNHRRVLVCNDNREPKRVLTDVQEARNRPIVFMFSGQGAQYANMGVELYRTEPVFRDTVDRCLEVRNEKLRNQFSILNSQFSILTSSVQPALFVIEYALAKLWESWGIRPAAMIGHSIGEYVAACLSGVFSLEDALSLVADRGRMMGELPEGAMLAVSLPEKEIQSLLNEGLSLAAVNGHSQCVVSGQTEAVNAFQQRLSGQGIHCQKLHTSHAFHSEMMDAVVKPFAERVRQIRLNPPQIPYISNVTGTWIRAQDATNPDYWARHLRRTVRFSDGIKELLKNPAHIFMEVGPGRTLSSFVMQMPDRKPEQIVLTSLPHPKDNESDAAFILTALGKLWLAGVKPDWLGLHSYKKPHRVSLPTYPFERKRFWVDNQSVERQRDAATDHRRLMTEKKADIADWFYVPSWKRMPVTHAFFSPGGTSENSPAPAKNRYCREEDFTSFCQSPVGTTENRQDSAVPTGLEKNAFSLNPAINCRAIFRSPSGTEGLQGRFLLFLDECGVGEALAERLKDAGHDVVTVKMGVERFSKSLPSELQIRYTDEIGAERFFKSLPSELQIRYTGAEFAKVNENEYLFNPAQYGDYNVLFRELVNSGKIPSAIVHLWSVTENAHTRSGLENLDKATDAGFSSLVFLVQAIAKQNITEKIEISVISNHLHEVVGGEALCPEKATVLGPVKVIPQEYQNIRCRSIDIEYPPAPNAFKLRAETSKSPPLPLRGAGGDVSDSDRRGNPLWLPCEEGKHGGLPLRTDILLSEIMTKSSEPVVALRGNYRWVQCFESIRIDKPSEKSASRFRQNGVYLITGGMGGIGFVIAEHLAKTVKAKLILTGRSDFPARETWNEWLAAHKKNDRISLKIMKIKELEAMGAEVLPINADVSDEEQMREAVVLAEKRFGQINGVVHTAGLADYEGVIQRRTKESAERILSPKVKGTLVLDKLLRDRRLNFFLLCSSLGNILYKAKFGQVGYNAANEFLDAFACYKNSGDNTLTVSVNWNDWQEVGMSVEAVKRWTGRLHTNSGMSEKAGASAEDFLKDGLLPSEGTEVFNRILEASLPRVAVSTQDLTILLKQDIVTVMPLPEHSHSEPPTERPGLNNMYVAPRNQTEQILADIWQNLLGVKPIGIYDNFFELGGHSLMGVQLLSRLRDAFHVELSLQTLFDKPTIAKLTDTIERSRQPTQDNMSNILKLLDIIEQTSEDETKGILEK